MPVLTHPCSGATYLFHLELLHLLIAFCSTQLYTVHATAYEGAHPFTEVLMRCAKAALATPPHPAKDYGFCAHPYKLSSMR